jgi:rare lipoprotein A
MKKTLFVLTRVHILLSALPFILMSCSPKYVEKGNASYYADMFVGRKTANGERFSQHKKTAAHQTLPFGTKVKIINKKNGKSVKVTINDRGPFKPGRIIDVSKKVARKLDMVNDGVVPVTLRYPKKYALAKTAQKKK